MAKPPKSEKVSLDGPAGALEGIVETGERVSGAAVVLHPHPQHGGTMHNKVAHTLARAFVGEGFATLRFNFRGTGDSDGEYDDGIGEVDDALAAMTWMRARNPEGPLWLGGFSFGAAMGIHAATRQAPAGLVSIAPAVSRFVDGLAEQPRCPWLVVQGDADELVAIDETVAWIDSLEPGPELQVFDGGEHFFHGRLVELREVVSNFVSQHSEQDKKKPE